jgi:hypothetical protein
MGSAPAKLRFRDTQIEMAHGAGGKASRERRRTAFGCAKGRSELVE